MEKQRYRAQHCVCEFRKGKQQHEHHGAYHMDHENDVRRY
jgi:hypothetical protein